MDPVNVAGIRVWPTPKWMPRYVASVILRFRQRCGVTEPHDTNTA